MLGNNFVNFVLGLEPLFTPAATRQWEIVKTLLSTFLCRFLHDEEVKFPSARFYGGYKHITGILFLSPSELRFGPE